MRTLLAAIPHMQPWKADAQKQQWALREAGKQILVYGGGGELDLIWRNRVRFDVNTVNARTGEVTPGEIGEAPDGKIKLPDGSRLADERINMKLNYSKVAAIAIADCRIACRRTHSFAADATNSQHFQLNAALQNCRVRLDDFEAPEAGRVSTHQGHRRGRRGSGHGLARQTETFDSAITTNAVVRQQFLDKARELNLGISSLAMSGFYAQSFAERPTVPRMTQDCIDTMKAMNVKIAFLPLGVLSDLVKHPELRSNVVERLKIVGAQAEKAGVIIGVETELAAEAQMKLLDDVGSPAIKIYYNFANALQNDRDLIKELRTLGKDRICQIHCTDQDGVWLQDDPKINMPKVKADAGRNGLERLAGHRAFAQRQVIPAT